MAIVEHAGIVKSINGRDVEVEIIRSSACGACEASGACGAECAEQIVVVRDVDIAVQPGDEVTVLMEQSAGIMAVVWGYVLPLVVFLVVMVLLKVLTGREGLAGLAALAALGPYYFILWRFRDKLKKTFIFRLKKDA